MSELTKEDFIIILKKELNEKFDEKLKPFVTKEYFEQSLEEKLRLMATKQDLQKAIEPLATKLFVAESIDELARITAEGFNDVRMRLDRHEVKLDRHEVKLDRHEAKLDRHEIRLERIENSIGKQEVFLELAFARLSALELEKIFKTKGITGTKA